MRSLRWIVFNELGMDAAYKSVLLTFWMLKTSNIAKVCERVSVCVCILITQYFMGLKCLREVRH